MIQNIVVDKIILYQLLLLLNIYLQLTFYKKFHLDIQIF